MPSQGAGNNVERRFVIASYFHVQSLRRSDLIDCAEKNYSGASGAQSSGCRDMWGQHARHQSDPETRSRSRSGASSVSTANGAGDGGQKASPILLHSHPTESLSTRPTHSQWRCIFGAGIASPNRGREPTAPDPRASVLALLAWRAWLAHAVVFLRPLPSNTRTPFLLTFLSFLLFPTHLSA